MGVVNFLHFSFTLCITQSPSKRFYRGCVIPRTVRVSGEEFSQPMKNLFEGLFSRRNTSRSRTHTFSSSSLCFCSRATSSSDVVDALCFICTFSMTRPSRNMTSSSRPLPLSLPGALRDLACPEVEAVGVADCCPWCGAGAAERCFLAGLVG